MLAREIRVRNPKKKGIYLSAVRSFVFNEVLALRIQQGLWGKTLPGDVMDEAGQPKWVVAKLKAGKKLDDLRI